MKATSIALLTFILGSLSSAYFERHGFLPLETFVLGAAIVSAAWLRNARAQNRRRPPIAKGAPAKRTSSQAPAASSSASPSTIERELTSALVNMGARKLDAARTARAAIERNPSADLVTLIAQATRQATREVRAA